MPRVVTTGINAADAGVDVRPAAYAIPGTAQSAMTPTFTPLGSAPKFASADSGVMTTRTRFPAQMKKAPAPIPITRKNVTGQAPSVKGGDGGGGGGSGWEMGSGSTLAGSQVIASPLDEGGVGSSDAAKKGALRRMSEPMAEIPKRRGWSSNGLPEDLEDEPMLRWVGLNMKWRYPVPYDAEHSYSCAGLVTACQRPVALSAVVIKWKKRWMIVKDNKAYLLKKPNSREASALIKLDDCVVDPSPFNALPHSFRLMPPPVSAPERSANEMMWVIVAATENAKLDWMAAIMTAAGWKEKSMAEAGRVPSIVLNPAAAAVQVSNLFAEFESGNLTPVGADLELKKSRRVLFPFQPPSADELRRCLNQVDGAGSDVETSSIDELLRSHNRRFFKHSDGSSSRPLADTSPFSVRIAKDGTVRARNVEPVLSAAIESSALASKEEGRTTPPLSGTLRRRVSFSDAVNTRTIHDGRGSAELKGRSRRKSQGDIDISFGEHIDAEHSLVKLDGAERRWRSKDSSGPPPPRLRRRNSASATTSGRSRPAAEAAMRRRRGSADAATASRRRGPRRASTSFDGDIVVPGYLEAADEAADDAADEVEV